MPLHLELPSRKDARFTLRNEPAAAEPQSGDTYAGAAVLPGTRRASRSGAAKRRSKAHIAATFRAGELEGSCQLPST